MTIKQYLDKYFEDHVEYNQELDVYSEKDFYDCWDQIQEWMDKGVQWCFDLEDRPTFTEARNKYIDTAVNNYIKNIVKPIYL